MPRYAYHGRSPSDAAWESSVSGTIRGEQLGVYEVEMPEPEEAKQYRARNLYDLPGEVLNEREVRITGGLTAHLGAAIKFHQSMSEVGSVFLIDLDRLPVSPTQIEYTFAWAEDHPGTYARIDSIDDFEVYQDGDLLGAGYHRREDDVPIVNKWTNQLRHRINNFAYADEAELAVYGTDGIDFSRALYGTASYLHTSRAVGGSVQGALAEYDGFTMGFSSRGEEDVTKASEEELAKWFQRVFVRQHGDAPVFSRSHMVVLYDNDDLRVRDEATIIPEEDFILAFDGSTVYRDPSQVSEYLGSPGGADV